MTHVVKTSGSLAATWTGDDTVLLELTDGTRIVLDKTEAEGLGRYLLFRNPVAEA